MGFRKQVVAMKLLLLLLSLSLSSPPIIQINEPLPQVEDLVEALKTDGALIFTGLGEEYSAALESLSKRAPYCLEGRGLTVEMDDGSERLTVARDTVGATGPFPDCVRNEAEVVGDAFDRVDKVFSQLMRKQFGGDLDVVEEENNKTKVWEELDTKTHLHVYRRSNKMTSAPLALPALATILSPAPRTVVARMRVAPPRSLPRSANPDKAASFWAHFSAPLETETGATLERLLRQRRSAEADNSNCSQDWPHACEHE